jgi:general secretion pathway protein N
MPRPGRLVAIGLAIFLCGLIVLFPARVAYRALAPDGVRLAGLSGTVWNGAAAESRLGGLYLGDLSWRFRPLALVTGKAGFAVSGVSASGPLTGNFAVAPGGAVHVSDLRGSVPLSAVGGLATLGGVDGVLELDIGTLVLEGGLPVRGTGTLELTSLFARQLASAPLGNFRARLETVEGVLTATFEDVSGMLDLSGTLEVRPDRSYSLTGSVAATESAPQSLVRQLSFLPADASGKRSFRMEGKL